MSDPLLIVKDFLAGFGNSNADDLDNIRRHMAEDAFFDTGTKKLYSRQETLDHLANSAPVYGITTFRCRNRHFAVDGNRVFNERWDDLIDDKGEVVATAELATVFEIEDGKIKSWRDYYNPDGLRAALAKRNFRGGFMATRQAPEKASAEPAATS
jgi:limonene-1,2-epoxide hydrolase